MYYDILKKWTEKKSSKEKLAAFSFYDSSILKLIAHSDIDLIRVDLCEFARLNGYKNMNSVDTVHYLNSFCGADIISSSHNFFFGVDVPISEIYDGASISISKILQFYKASQADILFFDVDYITVETIKRLSELLVPFGIYISSEKLQNEPKFLQNISSKLTEAFNYGALMIIVEFYKEKSVPNFFNSISVPILCSTNSKGFDGKYHKLSNILGIFDDNSDYKYLNLKDLIREAIFDSINEIKNCL